MGGSFSTNVIADEATVIGYANCVVSLRYAGVFSRSPESFDLKDFGKDGKFSFQQAQEDGKSTGIKTFVQFVRHAGQQESLSKFEEKFRHLLSVEPWHVKDKAEKICKGGSLLRISKGKTPADPYPWYIPTKLTRTHLDTLSTNRPPATWKKIKEHAWELERLKKQQEELSRACQAAKAHEEWTAKRTKNVEERKMKELMKELIERIAVLESRKKITELSLDRKETSFVKELGCCHLRPGASLCLPPSKP